MRRPIALTLALATAAVISSSNVIANEGFYLGPQLGYYYLDDNRSVDGDDHNSSTTLGPTFGYRFQNDWALELGYQQDISGDDIEVAELNFLSWFGEEEPNRFDWRPYFLGGVSYFELDEDNIKPKYTPSWQVQAGLGLSKLFESNWEVRMGARTMYRVHDTSGSSTDFAVTLGLVRYFSDLPAAPVVQAAPEPEPYVTPEPAMRTITVRLNVEFEFDKATVLAIYGDELEAIANAMQVHDDIDLVLAGHTDSIGTEDYNQDLSQRRADAVKAKLVETYSIPADRVSAQGYGETQPIAENSSSEGRQRNRRVIGEMSYSEIIPE